PGISRRLSLAGVAMLLALGPGSVHAATIVVDETKCHLWDAITAANSDRATLGCSAGAGADEIVLNADVTFAGAFPPITSEMTIRARTHSLLDCNGHVGLDVRFFSGGPVVLDGVRIRGCSGPGVTNAATLRASACTITGNTGGISNQGDLTIERSTISGNTADRGGGISNSGALTIRDS